MMYSMQDLTVDLVFLSVFYVVASPAGATAKYCDEYVCVCMCVSV